MEQPAFDEVLETVLLSLTANWHAAMPARVVRVDGDRIDAQPLVRAVDADGAASSRAQVLNIPVVWPSAGGAKVELPIAEDDLVLLFPCSRSIDEWRRTLGESTPASARRFALTDSFAIPLLSASAVTRVIRVTSGGVVELGNPDALSGVLTDASVSTSMAAALGTLDTATATVAGAGGSSAALASATAAALEAVTAVFNAIAGSATVKASA